MFLFASMPAGGVLGIPIRIHWSAPVGAFIWTLVSWCGRGPRRFASFTLDLGASLCVVAAVAAIVLLHELAHCLVARIWGVRTQGIYLFLFGGVALITDPASLALRPGQQIAVFAAGPASNLLLSLLAGLCSSVVHGRTPQRLLVALALMNLGIAAFNLLPIWPLDGGQLLRALLEALRLRPRLSDWVTLGTSLLVGVPYARLVWGAGNYWTFSILLTLMIVGVLVLAFLGLEPRKEMAGTPGSAEPVAAREVSGAAPPAAGVAIDCAGGVAPAAAGHAALLSAACALRGGDSDHAASAGPAHD